MTREEAKLIIEKTKLDIKREQRVLRGLQILAKYDSSLDCSFEHDQMWVANFDVTVARMTVEEVAEMAACGWFEDFESWSHF